MDKKKVAAIAAAGLLAGAFLGLSAWRYFTVVLPQEEQKEAEESALEQESKEQGRTEKDDSASAGPAEKYKGAGEAEFSILRNLRWAMAGGAKYASFSDPGLARTALVAKTAEDVEFEILATEGSIDDAGGVLAVVRLGEEYGTMTLISKAAAGDEAFADSPDSHYRFLSSLFGDSPFYDEPNRSVSIGGYERGISADLEKFKDGLNQKLESTIRDELPSVTEVTWLGSTTTTFSEDGYQLISTEYKCNDAAGSTVSVLYSPTDGAISVSVSGNSRAVVNEHIDLSSENVSSLEDGTVVIENPTDEQLAAASEDPNAIVNGGDAGSAGGSIVYPGEDGSGEA